MVPVPTYIYHITHGRNLSSILAAGGLQAYSALQQAKVSYVNMAHQSIQQRRANKRVRCGPGGTLHDYVPFYFAPRSPMLYTISQGNVEGYAEGQRPVIHLVSTVEKVRSAGHDYVFTDGHGIIDVTKFFTDPAQMDQIDWDVVGSREWYDTPDKPDRKRKWQAEFLVHRFFPWQLVTEIGVIDARVKARVEEILTTAEHKPVVNVRTE